MKNTKRIFASLLLVLLLFSLCGCVDIDEMRDKHAVFADDTMETVIYKKKEYKLLPVKDNMGWNADYNMPVYITQKDVPVLLASAIGESFYISKNEIFIIDDYNQSRAYCRSDMFETASKQMDNPQFVDIYDYEYYDYEKDDYFTYELTEQQYTALKAAFENGTPTDMSNPYEYWEYYVDIYQYTENKLITISKYHLGIGQDGNCYVTDYQNTLGIVQKMAPAEYNGILKQILAKYIESTKYFDEFYEMLPEDDFII